MPRHFPASIRRFAAGVSTMQAQRHRADYDPSARFSKQDASVLLARARRILADLHSVTPADKRDFALHVLFRERPGATN